MQRRTIDWYGVKNYCHLNDLEYFHTIANPSVDIMHDVLEGVASFTLERLLKYMVKQKIATLEHIQHLVDCFYFGKLFSSDKPPKIKLDKKNLGQSASQMYCLIIHIPFILFKYKDLLMSVWKPIETILKILQIAVSKRISERDVETLEAVIVEHLSSFKSVFNEHFRPKHHFLLHYPWVIRTMGPIIFFWAMRMEAKHQYFKQIGQKTKNFINLKKTMANEHQEKVFLEGFSLRDEVVQSKTTLPLSDCNDYDDYENVLRANFFYDS